MQRPALLVLAILLWLAITASTSWAEPSLSIEVDSGGTAHVHALLDLSASPETVQAVLTDYPHWPTLFPHGFRIVAVTYQSDGVLTDFYVPWRFLPGEFHLVTLTRVSAPGRLETNLVEGDFIQYRRVWVLSPGDRQGQTRAELEMDMQPKRWVPRWVFTFMLRRELHEHFEKLQATVTSESHP